MIQTEMGRRIVRITNRMVSENCYICNLGLRGIAARYTNEDKE